MSPLARGGCELLSSLGQDGASDDQRIVGSHGLSRQEAHHDERLPEMQSELDTLTARLSSSTPKRITGANAPWAVGVCAVGIFWVNRSSR
jgi:hypothetical protein